MNLGSSREQRRCLRDEAPDRIVDAVALDLGERDPRDGVRFRVALRHVVAVGKKRKTHVEVFVRGFVAAVRDRVDVDIEDLAVDRHERRQPGFLDRFAQRHAQRIAVAVGMSARLQPAIEFAVMQQQHERPVARHDPRRSRHVTDEERSLERVVVRREKIRKARDHRPFAIGRATIARERRGEIEAMVRQL